MSRRKILAGSTSNVIPIFVQDSSKTDGSGLGSLVYNTSNLAAKYRRQGDASWTTITLATMTAGTFTSGGFVADGGPVTGGYDFCPPNAACASGATWVEIMIYGAANMLPVLIEIELDAVNYQDAVAFGLSMVPADVRKALGNAITTTANGIPDVNVKNYANQTASVGNDNFPLVSTASIATAVWGAGSRTLSSFGTLVTDIVTAVWAAGSRTLSAFGFTVTANVDTNSIAAAVLAGLGGSTIQFISPLSPDGKSLQLVTGDSYTAANGNSLKFNIVNRPGLIGFTPHLRLFGRTADLVTGPAVTSGTQTITMNDLPASVTAALPTSGDQLNSPVTMGYQLRFVNGSEESTPINGTVQIFAGF